MDRVKVSASKFRSVGYDPSTQTLEVEFNDGGVMQYSRVSRELHRRFMDSMSKASFFEDHIQENFTPRRIR